jgi:hypothetical protein
MDYLKNKKRKTKQSWKFEPLNNEFPNHVLYQMSPTDLTATLLLRIFEIPDSISARELTTPPHFSGFTGPSMQKLAQYPEFGHDRFLSHPSQFIHLPIIKRSIVWATDSFVKQIINKYTLFYLEISTSIQRKSVWSTNVFRLLGILSSESLNVYLNDRLNQQVFIE